MRQAAGVLLALGLLLGVCWAAGEEEPMSETDRISYSVGYQVGSDFKMQDVELNAELMLKGVKDAVGGEKPQMTLEEMQETLVALKRRIQQAQQTKYNEMAQENLEKGEKFLAENAKREGVVKLPSGLQYEVLRAGEGKTPKAEDTVNVDYVGTLIDGTEFDNSRSRGEPATFKVNGVIAGWSEALQLMKEGAKWKLYIPAELGYGRRGMSVRIPPNSVLIFEVELLKVESSGG